MCEGNADDQLISSSLIIAVAPLWLLLKTNTWQHYTHMRTTDHPAAELHRPASPPCHTWLNAAPQRLIIRGLSWLLNKPPYFWIMRQSNTDSQALVTWFWDIHTDFLRGLMFRHEAITQQKESACKSERNRLTFSSWTAAGGIKREELKLSFRAQ